ncbi:hypothetical protein SAMN05421539_11055 [Jannaschia seohaensis]|uniref:Uncharacterized protein n=1 Tax=Jannaschia seohaensis TaxID=475081 RepID=A0A2Y9B207_9RHOB|nr:hypothetical protein BCF38_11055 [Jannaschia seohaensis]SSA49528.1 hypothetical protein SAMN05421539_11055 [Jannaschia seohaensis]
MARARRTRLGLAAGPTRLRCGASGTEDALSAWAILDGVKARPSLSGEAIQMPFASV